MTQLLPRNLQSRLEQALKSSPVVFLTGARQVGKSTLAKQVIGQDDSIYLTFDDPNLLLAAKRDPIGFLAAYSSYRTVVFDEVQRVPEIYLPLKLNVDNDRRSGRFLLTGSTSALFLPKLAEALVGRMQVLSLHGFSMGELQKRKNSFIDWCFSNNELPMISAKGTEQLISFICTGGFPEVATSGSGFDADAWFDSYVQTILSRDVRDIVDVDRLLEFPNLLRLLASRTATLQNMSELSRTTGIPLNSLRRYLAILEAVCLYQPLQPWHSNLGKRMVKSPKTFLADTGLVCYLMGVEANNIEKMTYGRVFENFVLCELRKQLGWSESRCGLYFWRTQNGEEVDFILESKNGELVGVEVKAASTVNSADLKGLLTFKDESKKKFRRGILLYQGANAVRFGDGLMALPISALWQ